ncbi:hypothetical protein PIB30_026651 [Stylosanthes scabra]|nr:hypothetical protein [Stylosanthes scabra]
MSGKEMLQMGRVDEVNISGTCHVLDACLDLGITRLVYCSTYNVVFGGQPIVNGDETLPYFPIDHHAVDSYGRSKSIAEQLVLKNNARPLKNNSGKRLYTCALRPAAIYGPGEDRHLPRIISMAKLGLVLFRIGHHTVKSDWVFVDNLVLALILASMGLLEEGKGKGKLPNAAGQAYFISDGSPVNTFEFLEPLLTSLDYQLPTRWLAVDLALVIGRICWVIYTILYPWLNRWWLPQPFILPPEVHKVSPFMFMIFYLRRFTWATQFIHICSFTGWGHPLFLLSQSQTGDRLCPHGILSRGDGFNHFILAREEKDDIGRAYHLRLALFSHWNDLSLRCCFLTRNWNCVPS